MTRTIVTCATLMRATLTRAILTCAPCGGQILLISPSNPWEIPVGSLRSGPEKALKVLNEMQFFSKGGPEREEMHVMFEMLCKNRNPEAGEAELELSYAAVTKIFAASRKEGGNKKAKRAAWQACVQAEEPRRKTRRPRRTPLEGRRQLTGPACRAFSRRRTAAAAAFWRSSGARPWT